MEGNPDYRSRDQFMSGVGDIRTLLNAGIIYIPLFDNNKMLMRDYSAACVLLQTTGGIAHLHYGYSTVCREGAWYGRDKG